MYVNTLSSAVRKFSMYWIVKRLDMKFFLSLSTAGSSVWKMKLKSYATDKDFLVGIFLFENSFVQSRLNLLLKLGWVFFFG